jgi:hypothetical protein
MKTDEGGFWAYDLLLFFVAIPLCLATAAGIGLAVGYLAWWFIVSALLGVTT